MPESLGEKLRQAREDRDISISEVAEQTRISALYLEAIENDDYGTLPGGIFNKGFVKSFAKYVGVDENEALQDYARIVAKEESKELEFGGKYKPEVLTDDRSGPSLIPTIVISVVILGLLAWGVFILVGYLQRDAGPPANNTAVNTNTSNEQGGGSTNSPSNTPLPVMDEIRVKLSTEADEISIESTVDGKVGSAVLSKGTDWEGVGKESVKVSYYKGFADKVNIEINGKKIETPLPPENYGRMGFDIEINKENLRQTMEAGRIPNASGKDDGGAGEAPQPTGNSNAT